MGATLSFLKHYASPMTTMMPPKQRVEFGLQSLESTGLAMSTQQQLATTQSAVATSFARTGSDQDSVGATSTGDTLQNINQMLGRFAGPIAVVLLIVVIVARFVLKLIDPVAAGVLSFFVGFFVVQFAIAHMSLTRLYQRNTRGLLASVAFGTALGAVVGLMS